MKCQRCLVNTGAGLVAVAGAGLVTLMFLVCLRCSRISWTGAKVAGAARR